MNHFEATAAPADFNPADFNPAHFNPADFNWGRKGVAYDWQVLFASTAASTLDHELATLAPSGSASVGALDAG